MDRHPYPSIPPDARSALCLFGCAFNGRNDGQYLLEAGLDVTFIDIDQERIDAMQAVYPDAKYLRADAYGFVRGASADQRNWDVVSADPFTNDMGRSLEYRKHFAAITGRMLVLGADKTAIEQAEAEDVSPLWWTERIERVPLVYWLVKRWTA